MEKYVPDIYQKSIYSINYDKLMQRGIKCILFDLDNTLVGKTIKEPNQKLKELFNDLKDKGFKVIIFSNSPKSRVRPFKEKLEIDALASAKKPLRKSFQKVMDEYGYSVSEIAIVGDQLLTDILGGNTVGITTVLVNPISLKDFAWTKINRYFENKLLKKMREKDIFVKGKYYD